MTFRVEKLIPSFDFYLCRKGLGYLPVEPGRKLILWRMGLVATRKVVAIGIGVTVNVGA